MLIDREGTPAPRSGDVMHLDNIMSIRVHRSRTLVNTTLIVSRFPGMQWGEELEKCNISTMVLKGSTRGCEHDLESLGNPNSSPWPRTLLTNPGTVTIVDRWASRHNIEFERIIYDNADTCEIRSDTHPKARFTWFLCRNHAPLFGEGMLPKIPAAKIFAMAFRRGDFMFLKKYFMRGALVQLPNISHTPLPAARACFWPQGVTTEYLHAELRSSTMANIVRMIRSIEITTDPEILECPICMAGNMWTFRTGCCEQLICLFCAVSWLTRNRTCPFCVQNLDLQNTHLMKSNDPLSSRRPTEDTTASSMVAESVAQRLEWPSLTDVNNAQDPFAPGGVLSDLFTELIQFINPAFSSNTDITADDFTSTIGSAGVPHNVMRIGVEPPLNGTVLDNIAEQIQNNHKVVFLCKSESQRAVVSILLEISEIIVIRSPNDPRYRGTTPFVLVSTYAALDGVCLNRITTLWLADAGGLSRINAHSFPDVTNTFVCVE